MMEVSISTGGDPRTDGCSVISPCSIEAGLGPKHGLVDAKYNKSEPDAFDADIPDCNEQHFENMRRISTRSVSETHVLPVPDSVSIIKHQPSDTDKCIDLPNFVPPHEQARLRMPRSIYIPKIFKPAKKEPNQQITWSQIRNEGRSPASSGCAPASILSPVMPPSFVKGLSAIASPRKKESNTKIEPPETLNEHTSKNGGEHICAEQKSPKTLCSKASGSKSSDSTLDWGIDVSNIQPCAASFEDNMAELQNLLVSIKTLGNQEAPIAEDVIMTYTEDSSEENKADQSSLKSKASAMNIAPVDSASNGSTPSESLSAGGSNSYKNASSSIMSGRHCSEDSRITYERELLSSGRDPEGAISFADIFNDPSNELYECKAKSGPLGIVVDTTVLGPRVRSLNPLSPMFGMVCPGDVIIGVDEINTVGMEAGTFWQVVSRKANRQERVLTMLRI